MTAIPASPEITEKPILTEREIEVLSLKAQGKTSRQVASILFVSKRTVDFHLANTYDKFKVRNLAGAVETARRFGLLQ